MSIVTDRQSLSKHPWEWEMKQTGSDTDEPGPFLESLDKGNLIGHHNVYEMSVTGIKKEEDEQCAKKGGLEDGHNNLWRQGDMLCEDFFYSAWRHCKSWFCLFDCE